MSKLRVGLAVRHRTKDWKGTLVREISPGMWQVRTPDGRLVQWQQRLIQAA